MRSLEQGQATELSIGPDRLRGWGAVAQRAVGPDGIVLPPPLLDQHFGFLERIEALTPRDLLPEHPVETLFLPVHPRPPGSMNRVIHTKPSKPVSTLSDPELRTIVRAEVR